MIVVSGDFSHLRDAYTQMQVQTLSAIYSQQKITWATDFLSVSQKASTRSDDRAGTQYFVLKEDKKELVKLLI